MSIKHINDTILTVLDILLFTLFFPICFFSVLAYCRIVRKKKGEKINALFLPSSGSIYEVIDKFGSLETFSEHNPQNFFGNVIICFFPTKRFFHKIYSVSIEAYDFRYLKQFACLSILVYFISLVYIGRKNKISMVRSLSPYAVGFIGRIVSWVIGVPFCVSLHEDDNRRYFLLKKGGERVVFSSRRLALLMRRFVYKTANMVLPIRESLKENVVNSGAARNKVFVIPHGIDSKLFDNSSTEFSDFKRKILASAGERKIIVSVCRHSSDNYILDAVESARLLAKKRQDFVFVLAGDGALYPEVRRLVDLYGLNSFVLTSGYVSRKEAIKYWLISDVGLCLMGGYSLIEAAMAAKPIIAYDVEWHYELVINDKTGFLLKENDVAGVANAIDVLLTDEGRRKRYGASINQLAIQKHSLGSTDGIKIACYNKLLGIS